jgi:hypothetical protein
MIQIERFDWFSLNKMYAKTIMKIFKQLFRVAYYVTLSHITLQNAT